LKDLRERLTSNNKTALTQAIHGLGGIGKTQIAVEYAYRYQEKYDYVFWIQMADDTDESIPHSSTDPSLTILNSYVGYCNKLQVSFDENEVETAKHAFKNWMGLNKNWLMIFDNADKPDCLESFLPVQFQGHVILTSRANSFTRLGILESLEIKKLTLDQANDFLIKRVSRQLNSTEEKYARALAIEIDGLPLALEQAGAYIQETAITFKRYLKLYKNLRIELLEEQKPVLGGYAKTVQKTWLLNFQAVEDELPAAVEVLRFCSYFAPDAIPYNTITAGASFLNNSIQEVLEQAIDPILGVAKLLKPLSKYSLINIEPGEERFSIHRIVQEVMKTQANSIEEVKELEEQVINVVECIYPWTDYDNRSVAFQLFSHCLIAAEYVNKNLIVTSRSTSLLGKLGRYFFYTGAYKLAEPLYHQALLISNSLVEKDLDKDEAIDQVVVSLNNLAMLYRRTQQYFDAEPLFIQAIDIVENQNVPENDLMLASLYNNLALLYKVWDHQEKYNRIEQLYLKALVIMRSHDDQSREVASVLSNLAAYYETKGRNQLAQKNFKLAIRLLRTKYEQGEINPDLGSAINNLANLYRSQEKYGKAKPLYKEALEILNESLGPEHPTTKTIFLNNKVNDEKLKL
tara:strand:- start:3730 stop:5619 length:1890 start_codon:yes stop_codon:yes gene_type:complete